MSGPVWIRSKEVCFLEGDWWNFGLALQEAFPTARYYRQPDYINRPENRLQTPEPPELPLHSHLLDTESGPYDTVKMVFDPGWRPRFRPISTEIGREPEDWYWNLSALSPPFAMFRLGGRIYDEPVPHPFKATFISIMSRAIRSMWRSLESSIGFSPSMRRTGRAW